MAHYSKEELEMYRHGQMSVLGRLVCAAHLERCPRCAKLKAELEEEDEFLREVRASVRIFAELSGRDDPASPSRSGTVV